MYQIIVINVSKYKHMKKIVLPNEHYQILRREFNVTQTTVKASLCYYNNSKKARAIRKRAEELLQKELTKFED